MTEMPKLLWNDKTASTVALVAAAAAFGSFTGTAACLHIGGDQGVPAVRKRRGRRSARCGGLANAVQESRARTLLAKAAALYQRGDQQTKSDVLASYTIGRFGVAGRTRH